MFKHNFLRVSLLSTAINLYFNSAYPQGWRLKLSIRTKLLLLCCHYTYFDSR